MKLLERLKAKQAKLLDYVDKADLYGGVVSHDNPTIVNFGNGIMDAMKSKLDTDILSHAPSFKDPFPAEHQKHKTTNQKMLDVLGLPAQTFEMSVEFPLDTPPYCTCSFYLTEAQLQMLTGSTALKVVEHGPTYPFKPFKIV